MYCEWKLKLRSHKTSWYLIEVVIKAVLTVIPRGIFLKSPLLPPLHNMLVFTVEHIADT